MTGSFGIYHEIRNVLITVLTNNLALKFKVSLGIFKNALLLDFKENLTKEKIKDYLLNTENIGQENCTIIFDTLTSYKEYEEVLQKRYDKFIQEYNDGFKTDLKGNLKISNKLRLLKLFDIHYFNKYTKLNQSEIKERMNTMIIEKDNIYYGLKKCSDKTIGDDIKLLLKITSKLKEYKS